MCSGKDTNATVPYTNARGFDVNVPNTATTKLSDWIHPQQDHGHHVAVDFVCTVGTTLCDSCATDATGSSLHANATPGEAFSLNT